MVPEAAVMVTAARPATVSRLMRNIPLFTLVTASLLLSPLSGLSAQELPNYVIGAVAEVVTHSEKPFNSGNRIKQGSGVFVDHNGCLYTNSHVVLNFETGEPEPRLAVNISDDRSSRAKYAFEGKIVHVEQGLDLAYVCPTSDQGIFTDYFERISEPMFNVRNFGEEVIVMGYPAAGEGTITVSPGHIIGFMQNPDLSQWQGTPQLEAEQLKIYKTDALAGPGVSGGVMVNKDLQLMGVPFAGTTLPGAFIFTLSEDVYQEFDRRMQAQMYRDGLVPLDCVRDDGYYRQSGEKFYDQSCTMPVDEAMEREVTQMYAAFCGKEISTTRLVNAIRRSKELGDLSKWSASIEARCGKPEAAPARQVASTKQPVAEQTESPVYGEVRLTDAAREAQLSRELAAAIGERAKTIAERDWKTLTNAYVYGGYPTAAIKRAIELGGVTVHPAIPYEAWKGSADFLRGME